MQYLQDYTELARQAFINQVHSYERFGAGWLADLDSTLTESVNRLRAAGVWEESITRYVEGYRRRVSAFFGAESRCASSFITGGSNFPVERMRKRRETARNRMNDLTEYRGRVERLLLRAAARQEKRDSGITPLIEAQRNLNRRVKVQAQMKEANAAIRKGKTREEQESNLLDLGYGPAHIHQLLKQERGQRPGYQAWELSNNNAQIVRLRGRVEELKTKEAQAERAQDVGEPQPIPFEGGYVALCLADDRLRIVYDAKPGSDVIAKLKSRGFRWSPSNTAWQRQITNDAKYAAQYITGANLLN